MSAELPQALRCTACAVERWASEEARYSANAYSGLVGPGLPRQVAGPDDAVLFTAPHAVNYFRGEYQHKAARYTGSGAEALAAVTGQRALTMAGPPRQVPYRDGPEYAFADALRAQLTDRTVVLDIIGMRDRQVDVCLGLGPQPNDRVTVLAERIQRGFTARGVRVSWNVPFPALSPVTVTAFAQTELAVPALQIAVASWLRDPVGSPTMAKLALDVLRNAVAALVSS
jgi:hypothetical protein